MKNIISTYGTLFVLLCNIFICIQISTASAQTAAAHEYKASVIAEIENSNFNPNVIQACISQATAAGYILEVQVCEYDAENDIKTAEIILEYSYEIPLLGVSSAKTTRGIAH